MTRYMPSLVGHRSSMSKKMVSTPNWSTDSRRSSASPCQRHILVSIAIVDKPSGKEGAKDTGSGRCNEVVKLLDQSEQGADDWSRFHDHPAAFWDVLADGHETTMIRQSIHDTRHGD
jgi:hypothetical protein